MKKILITILLLVLVFMLGIACYSIIKGIYTNTYETKSLLEGSIDETTHSESVDKVEGTVSADLVKEPNKCRAPMYGWQLFVINGYTRSQVYDILSYLDKYPNLNEKEKILFEEDKSWSEACYLAMNDWKEYSADYEYYEVAEKGYRALCHPKIVKGIKAIINTLDYMSNNPNTFDKKLIKRNLSNIGNLLDSYNQIDSEVTSGKNMDGLRDCVNLEIIEYPE